MSNLDRTWKNCLRMWKWVSENLPKGFSVLDGDQKGVVVESLKVQWLKNHRFTVDLSSECFFCEYAWKQYHKTPSHKPTRDGWPECDFCPAALVEPGFNCFDPAYRFDHNPKAFYCKLVALDKQRHSVA